MRNIKTRSLQILGESSTKETYKVKDKYELLKITKEEVKKDPNCDLNYL